jgi:hypothetical protein
MRTEGKQVPLSQQPKPAVLNAPKIQEPANYTSAPTNFRDIVEQRANAMGMLFCPQQNEKYEGKQTYTLGKHSIYFEETLIYYSIARDEWKLIGLESLFNIVS